MTSRTTSAFIIVGALLAFTGAANASVVRYWHTLYGPICIHVSEVEGDQAIETRDDLAERVAGAIHFKIEGIERRGRKVSWEPRCIKPDQAGFDQQLMLELSIKRQGISSLGNRWSLAIAAGESPNSFLYRRKAEPVLVLMPTETITDDAAVDALIQFVDRSFVADLRSCCTGAISAGYLYRAQTPVTGQLLDNRLIGFARCLEDVLVKTSADMRLIDDPRLEAYKARSAEFVWFHDYRDQMSGTPKRDEQGTRDRPYDLIAYFDEKKIDGVLTELGRKPWPSPRLRLGIFAVMEQGGQKRIVSLDGKVTDLQRDSLLSAADRRGMLISLPTASALTRAEIGVDDLWLGAVSPKLAAVMTDQGGDVALIGHLTWSDDDLGWISEWRMDVQGEAHKWKFRGVSFDEAFRRGIGDAAQILAGNGDPR